MVAADLVLEEPLFGVRPSDSGQLLQILGEDPRPNPPVDRLPPPHARWQRVGCMVAQEAGKHLPAILNYCGFWSNGGILITRPSRRINRICTKFLHFGWGPGWC